MPKGRHKKAHEAEHENGERWLLTYSDLITLLMVFFVLLYSMSSADATKFKKVSAALQQAFNVDVLQGSAASSIGDGGAPAPPMDTMISDAQVPQVARLDSNIAAVLNGVQKSPDVTVGIDQEGVVVRLSGSYLFDSGRADLKPNSLIVLDTIANELRVIPNEIRVDGHTDSIPLDSSVYPTNWELSTARALAVTRYLAETDGVQATRLMAAGFGEYRPLFVNDTREHRALNRRVEIHLLSSTLAAPAAPTPIAQPPTQPVAPVQPVQAIQPTQAITTEPVQP